MSRPKKICFTVTNDLTYDQRMIRICTSLQRSGYDVTLVGRKRPTSVDLRQMPFRQKRFSLPWNKGLLFYALFNLRLFFYLIITKFDLVCAIDLDTILPVLLSSKIKGSERVYDAHEFFTEMKEIRQRPRIQKIWLRIERFCVPGFRLGYTVSSGLADAFRERYGADYDVIRNLPVLRPLDPKLKRENFLLYQGAVNEARGFEYLIPALTNIPYRLVVCGDGNFMNQLRALIVEHGVENKVELRGMMPPADLRPVAEAAALGLGFAEKEGVNQFYALPNKFADYMHAGLPQIAMNFPEYARINNEFQIAVLIDELSADAVAAVVNRTMQDNALLEKMHENAMRAREVFCWQEEEKKLIAFYKKILPLD